jgi:hypothetical protein
MNTAYVVASITMFLIGLSAADCGQNTLILNNVIGIHKYMKS